jgi:hypothetical protein
VVQITVLISMAQESRSRRATNSEVRVSEFVLHTLWGRGPQIRSVVITDLQVPPKLFYSIYFVTPQHYEGAIR